jgi:hypothetical protein
MGFIENDHLIQAFLTHCPNPSLGKGIGIRSVIGGMNDGDPLGGEHSIKARGELAVVVMDQKSYRQVPLLELPDP